MAENVGQIYYTVTADTSGLMGQERKVTGSLDRMGREGEKLQSKMTGIATAISAVISAIAVESLVSKVVQAQRQFDVLFASLKTMTGGVDQANAAWARLEKFAATTPYSLQQSVEGFTKLKALGLDPTERSMTSFGNTAAAMGKDLMQMIEAVADASTGEFERLKEFGIKASKEGDRVSLTFQGVTTTIGNSSKEINEYLTAIGENQFAGAMSERMKTLDGDISNLGDSMDALYRTIAQSGFGDLIAQGVRAASEAIQEATQSIKDGELTAYFQKLRPYIQATEVAVTTLAAAITGRLVVALAAKAAAAYTAATAMGAATIATRGFTAALALMGGPIGIAITALGLLAWNWDKITGAAKTAADVSENAAARIAAALSKRPVIATAKLKEQLQEAEATLADLDQKIAVSTKRGKLETLKAQRDEVAAVVDDIRKAINSVGAGGGRGFVNPPLVQPDPDKPDDTPEKPKKTGNPFDQVGYLADLRARVASEYDKIDIQEAESVRKHAALLKEKKINEAEHAEGLQLIREAAAQQRQKLAQNELDDLVKNITDAERLREEDLRNQRQLAEQKSRADMAARRLIADAAEDPVAKIRLEEEAKLAELETWRAQELISLQTFEDAKLAIKKQTAAQEQAIQDANNRASLVAMGDLAGQMYSLLEKSGKERTALGKALFLASKALAVAEIIMSTEVAAAKAGAQLGIFGIPMATMIRATGYASAGMVAGMAIGQVAGGRQYGGPVSADKLYRVNERGAPEMFTAGTGEQYMMPTKSGKVTAADKIGGGDVQWNIVVNNTATGTQASASVDQQSRTVTIAVQEVASQIRSNTGPVWGALRGSTNVQGRM